MKKVYKLVKVAALSGAFCLFLTLSASAQRDRGGNGGGHTSGGGGGGGGFSGGHTSVSPPSRPSSPPPSSSSFNRPAASTRQSSPDNRPLGTQTRPSFQQGGNGVQTNRPFVSQRPNNAGNTNAARFFNPNRQNSAVQRNFGAQTPTRTSTGHFGNSANAASAQRFSNYQGSAYGKNHPGSEYYHGSHWANQGYYHYNRGYYGSYYAPRLGFSIGVLPFGYYPFFFGDYQYYYSDGLFYTYNDNQYTVVDPPVGAEITTLPSNAQSIVINGKQFYEVNGVYYEPITKDDGTLSYQVAGKDGELNTSDGTEVDNAPPPLQIGDIVGQLPDGCRKININGDRLYESPDGVYYKAVLDQDNNKVYKVVGLPADDDKTQGGN